jgi:phytoene dehydrogenase-like protein
MTDKTTYSAEKSRIANQVIEAFESHFGEIKTKVKMIDVSTPATVIRYTNNWKGSLEGWLLTPEIGLKQLAGTLPGLKNFYMAGQWVSPGGGLPTALLSGRNTAQVICKKDGKKFSTKSF